MEKVNLIPTPNIKLPSNPLANIPSMPSIPKKFTKQHWIYASVGTFMVLLGITTGFLLSRSRSAQKTLGTETGGKMINTAKVVGLQDESTFKDSAEGTLQSGGIKGEGTHHLERDGGPSQTAYLTSTVIDLGSFVGKKVKVWGQTVTARNAGWLMDVGKVEIIQ